MDIIYTWSVKIAQSVDPNISNLAPMITRAYLEGGKSRKKLFERSSGDSLGGFGGSGTPIIFQWVIECFCKTGPLLIDMLSSPITANVLAAISAAPVLSDLISSKKAKKGGKTPPTENLEKELNTILKSASGEERCSSLLWWFIEKITNLLDEDRVSAEERDLIVYRSIKEIARQPNRVRETKNTLDDKCVDKLHGIIEGFSSTLDTAGFYEDERDLLIFRSLKPLLEDPNEAEIFIKALVLQ